MITHLQFKKSFIENFTYSQNSIQTKPSLILFVKKQTITKSIINLYILKTKQIHEILVCKPQQINECRICYLFIRCMNQCFKAIIPHMLTLPAVIADTQFFSGEVAVTMIRTSTVGFTVRNVTSFTLPVFITFTIYLVWNRHTSCTLPMTRAIVRTRIDSVRYNSYVFKFRITEKEIWLFC